MESGKLAIRTLTLGHVADVDVLEAHIAVPSRVELQGDAAIFGLRLRVGGGESEGGEKRGEEGTHAFMVAQRKHGGTTKTPDTRHPA